MSEPIMQIKAGETIIPIKTNIGRNEPIDDVRRDIIDVVTTEPLTPTQIDAMKTNDWEMVWDNVTQGIQTGYTEIVEYHTWFARPLGDAEQVQVLQQQKQELIQQKSDLLEEKAELTEERDTLAVAKEELSTSVKTMKSNISTFFRGKNDDTLVELLSLMEEWALENDNGVTNTFEVGDARKRNGQPYTCIQGHGTEGDMNRAPEIARALWAIYHARSARFALPYAEPTHSGDIYKAGEYMLYTDDVIYRCIEDTDRSPEVLPGKWQAVDLNGNPITPPEPEEPAGELNKNGTEVWSVWEDMWTKYPGQYGKLYQKADRVTDSKGVKKVSLLDNNSYPTTEATAWKTYTGG